MSQNMILNHILLPFQSQVKIIVGVWQMLISHTYYSLVLVYVTKTFSCVITCKMRFGGKGHCSLFDFGFHDPFIKSHRILPDL